MSKNKSNAPIEEEEIQIFEFQDEDGNVEKFEFLDIMEFEGKEYAVLLPVTDDEDALMVHILEIVEELDSEYDTYIGIDDQELVDKIYAAFMEKHKEDFNFVD
ncbi:MAG: DUF1292 domain-containing protein [Clostridia bacterium]|nr:DUF1292 domain-containing protein [Clostridia bacterium]